MPGLKKKSKYKCVQMHVIQARVWMDL